MSDKLTAYELLALVNAAEIVVLISAPYDKPRVIRPQSPQHEIARRLCKPADVRTDRNHVTKRGPLLEEDPQTAHLVRCTDDGEAIRRAWFAVRKETPRQR